MLTMILLSLAAPLSATLPSATLPSATPASDDARCRPGAERASAQLRTADQAAARRDYRTANAALDRALQQLGTGYAPPPTIDDTGMHLVVAGSQQRKGKLKLAADLKRRVLLERLELCRRPTRR